MSEPEELFNAKQIAARLKLHPDTVKKIRNLPSICIGKSRRYSWPAVLQFLSGGQ